MHPAKEQRKDLLAHLIAQGECSTVEFKRSAGSDLGRELCAFANAVGGRVLIGVDDDGAVPGVESHNRLKSQVQNIARTAQPPIRVEFESLGPVLSVHVPIQFTKPYSVGGKFYVREGANCQQLSRDEIREFFYREAEIHFDKTKCNGFSWESDMDEDVWSQFRPRARIPDTMDAGTALRNLGLIDAEGGMTHAGAWLLARDVRKFTAAADVSCALFAGADRVRILDRRDFHSDIYSMIEETMLWILSKINVEYVIKAVAREERPELPEEAVREAVVNAVAHRDYRSTANVQVCLFADRLEIVSPGGLPKGMTEADLGTNSVPRNPLLFNILHRMGAVERIGSGISRIRELCHAQGLETPDVAISDSWVKVVFPRRPGTAPGGRHIFAEVRESLTALGGGATAEPALPDNVLRQLAEHLENLNAPCTAQIVAQMVGYCLAPRTAREIMAWLGLKHLGTFRVNYLHPILQAGWLEMTIPDKPKSRKQRYRLTGAAQELVAKLTE